MFDNEKTKGLNKMKNLIITKLINVFSIALCVFSFSALGLVDTKNGNYSKTFLDFEIRGAAFPLKLERTYNSRSLYKGLFGMGWCSNIETRLDMLPDGVPKITVCGGGLEISFLSKNTQQDIKAQVEAILTAVRKQKQNQGLSGKYFEQLKQRLMTSNILRNEFFRAYNVKGRPKTGQIYFAEGRRNDILQYNKDGYFRRTLPSGAQQFFSAQTGNLIQVSDRMGNYFKITWRQNQPQSMVDNKGKTITFVPDNNNRISKIQGLGRTWAEYLVEDDQLKRVKNKDGVYVHRYDDLYNLVQTVYPAEGKGAKPLSEILSYNNKKDFVTSFQNKRKCVEVYKYETNKNDPKHYWTEVQKKCGKVVTNVSRYEFWNKKGADGTLYLHRARQDINGNVTDIVYHPRFKRAKSVNRNGRRMAYEFYKNGLMRWKSSARQRTHFAAYHPRCRKPSEVKINSINAKGKAVGTEQVIKIEYDAVSCLIDKVSHSDGRWVDLGHDDSGRIDQMQDQAGRIIKVGYNNLVNRPNVIQQKGVGEIALEYDEKTGKSKGLKKGGNPMVMAQVMKVFNGFLEIIGPVASEMSI